MLYYQDCSVPNIWLCFWLCNHPVSDFFPTGWELRCLIPHLHKNMDELTVKLSHKSCLLRVQDIPDVVKMSLLTDISATSLEGLIGTQNTLGAQKTDVCKVFSCADHLSWSSQSFGISLYQDCRIPCSYGNADSLSSLSSCGNADSLSPLCAHLGVLHPERQDYREEGGGGPGRRVLPHYRDAQQRGKGEGGPPSTQRIINEDLRTAVSQNHPQKDGKELKTYAVIFFFMSESTSKKV